MCWRCRWTRAEPLTRWFTTSIPTPRPETSVTCRAVENPGINIKEYDVSRQVLRAFEHIQDGALFVDDADRNLVEFGIQRGPERGQLDAERLGRGLSGLRRDGASGATKDNMRTLQPIGDAFGDFAAKLFQVDTLAVHRKVPRVGRLVGVALPSVNHFAHGEVVFQLVIKMGNAVAEHEKRLLLIRAAALVLQV